MQEIAAKEAIQATWEGPVRTVCLLFYFPASLKLVLKFTSLKIRVSTQATS